MSKFNVLFGAALAVSTIASADLRIEVAQANNEFGTKLFKKAVEKTPQENVFVSPISASMALSLLYHGAASENQAEIGQTLGFPGVDTQVVRDSHKDLLKTLNDGKGGFELSLANSVWSDQSFQLKKNYVAAMVDSYDAEVQTKDFNDPSTLVSINKWASDKTKGKIPMILDQLDSSLPLVLMNATYFKADWTKPFNAAHSHDMTFKSPKGNVQRKFMYQKDYFKYVNTRLFQAIELPYGDEAKASMIVILPAGSFDTGAPIGIDDLQIESIVSTVQNAEEKQGNLMLPKFSFEYEIDLIDPLQQLGIVSAFGAGDWSNLSNEQNLRVGKAIQKTFVAVDEKGTEAAAVTAIGMERTSMPLPPAFNLTVDRPFLVVLKDNRTNTVLFLGQIVDPVSK
jgi:serine protease inhibitor